MGTLKRLKPRCWPKMCQPSLHGITRRRMEQQVKRSCQPFPRAWPKKQGRYLYGFREPGNAWRKPPGL